MSGWSLVLPHLTTCDTKLGDANTSNSSTQIVGDWISIGIRGDSVIGEYFS